MTWVQKSRMIWRNFRKKIRKNRIRKQKKPKMPENRAKIAKIEGTMPLKFPPPMMTFKSRDWSDQGAGPATDHSAANPSHLYLGSHRNRDMCTLARSSEHTFRSPNRNWCEICILGVTLDVTLHRFWKYVPLRWNFRKKNRKNSNQETKKATQTQK